MKGELPRDEARAGLEAPRGGSGEPVSRGRGWVHRRIAHPLAAQLRQGATPSLLAWSLALGLVLSVLPLPGTTTLFCMLAALLLRLNPVAIQVANFAAAPLQLAMLLPFIQWGQRLFGAAALPLSRAELGAALSAGAPAFISRFGLGLAHGVIAWALCAGPAALALQLLLRQVLVRGMRKLERG